MSKILRHATIFGKIVFKKEKVTLHFDNRLDIETYVVIFHISEWKIVSKYLSIFAKKNWPTELQSENMFWMTKYVFANMSKYYDTIFHPNT